MTKPVIAMPAHADKLQNIAIADVKIADRFRKDLGDLDELAASIDKEGLLQPIGITPENGLVFGERRLRAAMQIGWQTIPARVVHVSSILAGEFAENEMRKNFTASERVAIAAAVEAEIGERRGRPTDKVENFPQFEPGVKTREIAATKAGFGNYKTYEHAKRVLEKAVDGIREQMDAGKLAISSAALIADESKPRQQQIAAMPVKEQRAAVREIRERKLPTPKQARQQAIERGVSVLSRQGYQTPQPEAEFKVANARARAVGEFLIALDRFSAFPLAAAEIAKELKKLTTKGTNFAGKCGKWADLLTAVVEGLA